jgi:hypothetical protein
MKVMMLLVFPVILARGAEQTPNIVFILADDPGITDIGACARHFDDMKAFPPKPPAASFPCVTCADCGGVFYRHAHPKKTSMLP